MWLGHRYFSKSGTDLIQNIVDFEAAGVVARKIVQLFLHIVELYILGN